MKRWAMATAGLAALALLVLAGTVANDLQGTDTASGPAATGTAASSLSGIDGGADPASPRRALLTLPAMAADGARPLRLTRAMMELAWRNQELTVALPDGGSYPVELEGERFEPGGQWTVVGRVQTTLGAQAMVLTFGPDAVFGVLPRPDGSLLQVTTSRGTTTIAPAGGLLPPGSKTTLAAEPDYVIAPPGTGTGGGGSGGSPVMTSGSLPSAAVMSTVEIVVLALYTNDLVELRGSVSAAETEVANLFAITNQAHLDSGTRVRIKLAGQQRIDIDPQSNNHDALYAISGNNVAGIDLVGLRDQMAADLVAVLRPHRDTHGSCGVAWLNGGGRSPQGVSDHVGFSVSNVDPCGPYVLAHELGHNMGSAHDRETQSINGYIEYGVYRYSFGYRQDGPPAFATIMAYAAGQPWIGRFSNPASNACGAACGVDNQADNVRSIGLIAPFVAAFRGPPGTLSISDAQLVEPETGNSSLMVFRVRLSGLAPAGGVSFDVAVAGGSAQDGVDYVVPDSGRFVIPAGMRDTDVVIDVRGDTLTEPDETIILNLVNVTGAAVHDGEAVGTIVNDDPRLTLSGRILFDKGVSPPTSAFTMGVSSLSGEYDYVSVPLTPPDFSYELSLVKGASPHFNVDAPPPFAILPFTIDEIETSRVANIRLHRGFHVSGRVRLPAGQPALAGPMDLTIRASIDGVYQSLPYTRLEAPDYRYDAWVVPGAWLFLETNPPAPYQRFFAVHNDVRSDIAQDITLSTLPSLVIWGGGRLATSPGTQASKSLPIELSAPAPAGGVRLRYRTVDGTATAGSDYTSRSGSLEIPEGQRVVFTESIEIFGDDEVEGDEYFLVEVTDVIGANPVVTRQRVTIAEKERRMSDPSPRQAR